MKRLTLFDCNQGAGLSIGQENTMNEVLKAKQDLQRQLEASQASLATQTETTALLQQVLNGQSIIN